MNRFISRPISIAVLSAGILCPLTPALEAQEDHTGLSFSTTVGTFFSDGDEKTNFKRVAPGYDVAFGLRPSRGFQFDGAMSMALRAAGLGHTIQTTAGARSTMDYETFVQFGGRFLFPNRSETVVASVGGGLAFALYSEEAGDIYHETVYCTSCKASTSGVGYYNVVGVDVFMNETKTAGLALALRTITSRMNGYFATRPEAATNDRPRDLWVSLTLGFILRP